MITDYPQHHPQPAPQPESTALGWVVSGLFAFAATLTFGVVAVHAYDTLSTPSEPVSATAPVVSSAAN